MAQNSDAQRHDDVLEELGTAGGATNPHPGGAETSPPGAVHHVRWGNDWLSITAHYTQRELGEADPRRPIEEPHGGKREGRE